MSSILRQRPSIILTASPSLILMCCQFNQSRCCPLLKVMLDTQGSAEYNAKSYGVWFPKFQGGTSKDSCCTQWYFPSKSLKHYDESRRWDYREIFKFIGYSCFSFTNTFEKNTIMREGKDWVSDKVLLSWCLDYVVFSCYCYSGDSLHRIWITVWIYI